jgi:hypothetical protein
MHPEYGTPEGARDKCGEASAQFLDLVVERGITNDTWAEEVAVVRGTSHRAAMIDGAIFVDWTARQFDPAAPFPVIFTQAEEWPVKRPKRTRRN